MKNIIKKLSKYGKLFYYGSTALLEYENRPKKIYHIITNINIAQIGQVIPNIKFQREYFYDCYFELSENEIVTFFIEENEEKDDFLYLKKIGEKYPANPLYNFFYSPTLNKYYSINDDFLEKFKKNILEIYILDDFEIEEILDIAYFLGESEIKASFNENKNYMVDFENSNIRKFIYLPLLEYSLTSKFPYNAIIFLDKINLLSYFFPFLEKLRGIEQDRILHPEGDVFEHTLHCFQFVKYPSIRLVYGLLLHDFGKSYSSTQKNFRFHSSMGSKKVKEILRPYGYSADFILEVEFLVEYHMVNSYFFKISDYEKNKMFKNELGVDLLKLYKADTLGSIGKLDTYHDVVSSLKRIKSKIPHYIK